MDYLKISARIAADNTDTSIPYGWWILPDGNTVESKSTDDFNNYAERWLIKHGNVKKEHLEDTNRTPTEMLISKGAIQIREHGGALFIVLRSFNNADYKEIQNFINENFSSESVPVAIYTGSVSRPGEKIYSSTDRIIKNNGFEALQTKESELEIVVETEDSDPLEFKEIDLDGISDDDLKIELDEDDFQSEKMPEEVRVNIKSLLQDAGAKKPEVEEILTEVDREWIRMHEEMEKKVASSDEIRWSVAAVFGRGWWILPDRKVQMLKKDQLHADLAADYFGVDIDKDESEDGGNWEVEDRMIQAGGIQIRESGDYVYVVCKNYDEQQEAIREFLANSEIDNRKKIKVFEGAAFMGVPAVETGTIGDLILNKVAAFVSLERVAARIAGTSIAARIHEAYQTKMMGRGWWVTPDGKQHKLEPNQMHEEFALEWFKDHGQEDKELSEDTEEDLIREGAVSVREYKGHLFATIPTLSRRYIDWIADIIMDNDLYRGGDSQEIVISKVSRHGGEKIVMKISEFLEANFKDLKWGEYAA